jgi:hypothetical protein
MSIHNFNNQDNITEFKVMKVAIIWDIAPRSPYKNQCSRGTSLHGAITQKKANIQDDVALKNRQHLLHYLFRFYKSNQQVDNK